jgi:hypothetical protein
LRGEGSAGSRVRKAKRKPFETAGSPVAYLDAPGFAKFVAEDSARLIAAVKKIGKVE